MPFKASDTESTDSDSTSNGNAGVEQTFQQTRSAQENSDSDPAMAKPGVSSTASSSSSRIRLYICYAVTGCVMVAGLVALLFVFGVLDNSHVPQGFFDSDPFGGRVKAGNPEDAHAWANGGSGLQLYILNAVDESWQSFFAVGVADWENGAPDALTLPVRKVAPEKQCDPLNGVLKVCNGNYGETGWKGLNAVILDRTSRDIFTSSAMMNDFYLAPDNDVERTYTMCHEIGHGFGLPHWDENFWNRDLGNCMDYTNSPQNNLRPDTTNFEFLAAMYGQVGVVPAPEVPGGSTSGNGSSSNNAKKNKDKDKDKEKDRIRRLRGIDTSSTSASTSLSQQEPQTQRRGLLMEQLPDDILIPYRAAMEQLLLSPHSAAGSIIHDDEYGLGLEFDLGDNIVFEARMLKA